MSMSNNNPVANPYAKQRKTTNTAASASAAAASDVTAGHTHTSLLRPGHNTTTAITGTSFSQAFAAMEDTVYYQHASASRNPQNTGKQRQEQATIPAEQGAWDAAAQQNVDQTSHATMSDRDHHVLLLQPHVLYVSTKQRGNGVLNYIRNVPMAYTRMVPDYVMSTTRCALFLSCKYHSLNPHYIHRRIAELKTDFTLRILLVLVDIEDNANTLLFLNKLAVTNNLTLILAWTEEEAARYLETYKALDGKDATLIQKKEQTYFADQVADFLGTCRGVNKTDAAQLLAQFSTLRSVLAASSDELALVPGMGQVKVQRLFDALHKPFSKKAAAKRRKMAEPVVDEREDGESGDEEHPKNFSVHTHNNGKAHSS
jgi:DNA excision repair protein ERCC-1